MNHLLKLTVVLFLLLPQLASAQSTGKISGSIQSADQKAISQMIVSLLSTNDNALVKTEITQPDGSFLFENIAFGTYIVSIEETGYKPFIGQPVTLAENQPESKADIILEPLQANSIAEVTVQKKKAFAEYKIDRTVVNVDAMISSAGSDAMDVLEKSPGITVDQSGTITFKGKSGVMVFIDDKPTYLSGADLEAYLKSLPASMLDQIELITNPPAKYEAAGSAGIINIKTKKIKSKGFNGNVTSRVSGGKKYHSRNGISLNYKQNKVRVFGNANYATQEFENDLDIYRTYKNPDNSVKSFFDQSTDMNRRQNTANVKFGMDYYASDKTTWGMNFTGLSRYSNVKTDGNSDLRNPMRVLDSTIVADNYEKTRFLNGGANLNFSHEFDSIGKKITADADFLVYDDQKDQRYRNYIYQPDHSLSSSDESVGWLPSRINIYTFKTDYVHPMKKEQTFETGYKISYSQTDNIAEYNDIVGGASIPNYNTSNHFKYDEIINAVYVNYNRNFRRFSVQTGLRLENTISKGNQLGNVLKPASRFKKDYTNLFPTVYVMYKLDSIGNNQLAVNYGKRINRPYYQDLNPFLSPLDKFTFYSGNPYLEPSFAHNIELSYRFKGFFSTTASYSHTKDNIDETLEIVNEIYYSRPGNIAKSETISLNAQADVPFAKWLSTSIYAEVTNLRYDSPLYSQYLKTEGTFFYGSVNNRLVFGSGWSGELSGWYLSGVESGQVTTRPKSSINAAVQKKVFGDQGSVKLSINDMFYSNLNFGTINNLSQTDAWYENRGDTRYVALTFTYAFGKRFESKNSSERSGSESEQNRVKS
ncbi:TonB-dependent receptor [Flavobacterium sp.]|uniref:TonB-dependent receptor n=1 Tax=Flavobacterium sp. TaxID=239 RepID=UPI0039E44D8C